MSDFNSFNNMEPKKNRKGILFAVIAAVFVVVLVGATFLYNNLKGKVSHNQLAVNTEQSEEQSAREKEQETATASGQTGSRDSAEAGAGTETSNTESSNKEDDEKYKAPDFKVYDADGKEVHLSDYIGKPIVLNFWASWCGPCKMEMPDFDKKYQEMGESVQFLMVNMTDGARETVEVASAHVEEQGYSFPVFYDKDSDAAQTYGITSLPTTFFIDAAGRIIANATGAIDEKVLQQGIDMITKAE